MYHIKPVIALKHICLVSHSHAVTFSIKKYFDKGNNIFQLKNKAIYIKPLIVYGTFR